MSSVFNALQTDEISKIRALGALAVLPANEYVFKEGDPADFLYLIDAGRVSLHIDKFNTKLEIQSATTGDWFGELAVYCGCRRTASAITVEETRFLKVSKDAFHGMLGSEPSIEQKIRRIVDARNEKLVLEEKMVNMAGSHGLDMHIGIKGDPSLRESAMERARYESVVDKVLPELIKVFEDLLLNRTAHRILIGFNNGEIRISTLLDPFSEEFHPALRLLDASYIERHFPRIDYAEKAGIIRSTYQALRESPFFSRLPGHLHRGFSNYFEQWEPVSPAEISNTLSRLEQLRTIPNFYARNITVGILKDAIHMQFNCDGTHIVSARGYERFLEENL